MFLQVSLVRPVAVENPKDKPLLLYLPGDFPFVDQFHFVESVFSILIYVDHINWQVLMALATQSYRNCQGWLAQDLTSGMPLCKSASMQVLFTDV